jgi:hypothetical protein
MWFIVWKGFGLSSSSYEKIWWTQGFMCFGPSERNTLHPWREGCIAVCMMLFKPWGRCDPIQYLEHSMPM